MGITLQRVTGPDLDLLVLLVSSNLRELAVAAALGRGSTTTDPGYPRPSPCNHRLRGLPARHQRRRDDYVISFIHSRMSFWSSSSFSLGQP